MTVIDRKSAIVRGWLQMRSTIASCILLSSSTDVSSDPFELGMFTLFTSWMILVIRFEWFQVLITNIY